MTTTRVALVTGAGSGMGRSTAECFLDRGWTVLALDPVPVEIDGADGRLVPIAVDVRDRDAVESALATRLLDACGSIHAVANVAGIYPPSTLETVTTELFHRVFDVNVLGVLNVMAAAVPYMPEGSAIVNFASVDRVHRVSGTAGLRRVQGSRDHDHQGHRAGACTPPDPGERDRSGMGRHAGQCGDWADAGCRSLRSARPRGPAIGDCGVGLAAHRRRCRDVYDRRDRHLVRRRRHPLKLIQCQPISVPQRKPLWLAELWLACYRRIDAVGRGAEIDAATYQPGTVVRELAGVRHDAFRARLQHLLIQHA